ncbi:hypothetical protein MRS76_20315 [Rhizobiaceae bacterium n13]|uniref:hypothetical protein n=1 Tax=Ferirhizobium litorale TaxID=2927786 RepID=UPI0024B28BE1|nr:hypothetical protein [Fererhizobium litorale]MDI7864286.1 hypothetical protein [Fererhizobium litorale]
MKYNPPFGSPDPNAGYQDRNTPGAVSGSRVPAAAIENPQREIMAVIAAAGLDASNADLTQLLQAIQYLIAQSTGEGGDSNFVLMTEARTRLRIFPEVLTSDGRLPVTSPATGQVRIPAGYDFLHRGIFNVTTVQTDFATAANKVYHLRWNKTTGYALKDLADVGYNPGALAEDNVVFDSSYDDMLIARVVTNGANVVTITNLANKDRLFLNAGVTGTAEANAGANLARFGFLQSINWARTPTSKSFSVIRIVSAGSPTDGDVTLYDVYPTIATSLPATRYQSKFSYLFDYATAIILSLDFKV